MPEPSVFARPPSDEAPPSPTPSTVLASEAGVLDEENFREAVSRVVRAIVGRTNPDAEDIVQDAMLALVIALPRFRGECQPKTFASRIAARVAIAAARRSRRERSAAADLDVDHLESIARRPTDEIADRRTSELLVTLLTRIPPEQARTLCLRAVERRSLPEIAAETAVPLNTVRSRVRLAKAALRAEIDRDPAFTDLAA